MRSTAFLLVLSAVALPASAVMVKEGSTCIVTPISATPAAAVVRSLGTVPPEERDLNPEADPWADQAHYPRAEPGGAPPAAAASHPRGSNNNQLQADDTNAALAITPRQNQVDDTPQIMSAFTQCGKDGTIILREGTYHIRQVMDTSDLRNVSVEIHGTLLWSSDNLAYWRQASFGVTYAGRQTAWRVGGRDIAIRGFGKALFDGNGQAWIDLAKGASNFNGRPISLTVWHGTNVLIDGITWWVDSFSSSSFPPSASSEWLLLLSCGKRLGGKEKWLLTALTTRRMAQFWHTFVAHSQNVTMTNLDMETYSKNSQSSQNTDGTNTWNSKDVTIANWTVKCGDVSRAPSCP